jgi:hypothetical protein
MNGLYEISSLGRIKSLYYEKEKILKPSKNNKGYLFIYLYKDKDRKHFYIHRLVAETFIKNPNNSPCVNHKDENPLNNNLENLEWCSHLYNMTYGTIVKRRSTKKKKAVNQYDKTNNFIKEWESAIDIERVTGIAQGSIIRCCRRKQKTAGGYIWKYKN